MFLGRVIGTVWSSVKWPELSGLKLLLVQPYNLSDLRHALPDPAQEAVVCADLLDAGVGDDVIIAYGHAARVAAWEALLGVPADAPRGTEAPPVPIDAAVVAVVDSLQLADEPEPPG
jgi:ethanolamine utilization protein EutN